MSRNSTRSLLFTIYVRLGEALSYRGGTLKRVVAAWTHYSPKMPRGMWKLTVQLGASTTWLMRRSPATEHSM
jgi:hypothetical protein